MRLNSSRYTFISSFTLITLMSLLAGCACDFLGLEHVVDSKTPFEKRADDDKKNNPYARGGESDTETAGNLKTIYFDYKAVTLNKDQQANLDSNIEELIRNPDITVTLSSHSDSVGGPSYNEKLSSARARYVVNYMIRKGIATNRLTVKIIGVAEPIVSDNSHQIKSYTQILAYKKFFNKNRRINFIIR